MKIIKESCGFYAIINYPHSPPSFKTIHKLDSYLKSKI